MPTAKTKTEEPPKAEILYAEAIRIALNNIEGAVATMTALGYAVSAHIARGKILSIGVAPNNNSNNN